MPPASKQVDDSRNGVFDLILTEIRSLRSDLTENREQLSALREDVNMLIKKRISQIIFKHSQNLSQKLLFQFIISANHIT